MSKYFQNVETDEFVTVEEGGDSSLYETEIIKDTTNLLWREVSKAQAEPVVEESVPEVSVE